MLQVIKEVKTFEELDERTRQKAIENLYDINVDFGWWETELDMVSAEWREKYGIDFNSDEVYFSIDRDNYLFFRKGYIWVDNRIKLGKALKLNRSEMYYLREGRLTFYFDNNYYAGGRGSTDLCVRDERPSDKPDLSIDIEQWFNDIVEELLSVLRKSYEYYTSEEAIIDTIKANEYMFDEDGNIV